MRSSLFGPALVCACALALLLTQPVSAMDGCHSFGEPALPGSPYRIRLETVAASYANSRYSGDYEGAAIGLELSLPRMGAAIAMPMYRLVRNGRELLGPGDLVLGSHVTVFESERRHWMFGAILMVSLPTGSATLDLGMGHVMAMPAFFARAQLGRFSGQFAAGYGIALGEHASGHVHDPGIAPIVAPMNRVELELNGAGEMRIAKPLAVRLGASLAVPIVLEDGFERASGFVGLGFYLQNFTLRVEGHAPLLGNPFQGQGRVALSYGF